MRKALNFLPKILSCMGDNFLCQMLNFKKRERIDRNTIYIKIIRGGQDGRVEAHQSHN